MMHPYLTEKTNIDDMAIGDCIKAEYVAPIIDEVGAITINPNSTKSLINKNAEITPNGSFYFIKVDTNFFISDRVLQHNLSWNKLNSNKFIEGGFVKKGIFEFNDISTNRNNFIITSSAQYVNDGFYLYKIFEHSNATSVYDCFFHTQSYGTQSYSNNWFIIQNPCKICYTSIKLTTQYNYSDSRRLPKTIRVLGSNDSVNWTQITIISNIVANSLYNLNNNTEYKFYKFELTGKSSTDYISIHRCYISYSLTSNLDNSYLIRLLSGGICYIDEHNNPALVNQNLHAYPSSNEFDKYIMKNNLNGIINSEEIRNEIWNLNNVYCWCKETPKLDIWNQNSVSYTNSHRILRGNISANNNLKDISVNLSSSINNIYGFRPILQIKHKNQSNVWN